MLLHHLLSRQCFDITPLRRLKTKREKEGRVRHEFLFVEGEAERSFSSDPKRGKRREINDGKAESKGGSTGL